MTDLEQLTALIESERTWTKRMSDGYISAGSNTSEHIAQTILNAGWTAPPAVEPVTCAWCTNKARGSAWHNDMKLHPSCGRISHGNGWVPPLPEAHNPARDH